MRKKILNLIAVGLLAGPMTVSAVPLVTNGGFETGDLTGWTSSGLGTGTCPTANNDWNVSTTGAATGCNAVANPSGSSYAAYVMNDGTGPLNYLLTQSIFVSFGTTGGALTFDWVTNNFSDPNRLLTASLNGTTVFSSSTSGSSGWLSETVDVSAILAASAGTSINLVFDNFIPSTWTGPAGLGLDNVSIEAAVSAPEPSIALLLASGIVVLGVARRKSRV